MENSKCAYREVFKRVIQPSINSRNDGQIAKCCNSFFTRKMKSLSLSHIGPVTTVRVWCQLEGIKTEDDLRTYWKTKEIEEEPNINESNCRQQVSLLEKSNELLKKRVAELENRILELEQEATKEKKLRCTNCGKWSKYK